MNEATTIVKPSRKTTGEPVSIRTSARLALAVTSATLGLRVTDADEPITDEDHERLRITTEIATRHPVAAQLLPLAVQLGNTLDPDDPDARWLAAVALRDEQNRIDPATIPITFDLDAYNAETCSHGRSYDDDCNECEA